MSVLILVIEITFTRDVVNFYVVELYKKIIIRLLVLYLIYEYLFEIDYKLLSIKVYEFKISF